MPGGSWHLRALCLPSALTQHGVSVRIAVWTLGDCTCACVCATDEGEEL